MALLVRANRDVVDTTTGGNGCRDQRQVAAPTERQRMGHVKPSSVWSAPGTVMEKQSKAGRAKVEVWLPSLPVCSQLAKRMKWEVPITRECRT